MRVSIQPYILGSGGSGKAIAKSLAVLRVVHPEWETEAPVFLPRNVAWPEVAPAGEAERERRLLFIANPHGLHAEALVAAERAGFRYIVVEKPAVVRLSELERVRAVRAEVAVLHGYRMLWGPQWLADRVRSGEWGPLVTVEGRYWQSSAAQGRASGWKDDPALNGPHDTLVDLGSHVADLAVLLAGERVERASAWLSTVNAGSAHRDTHARLELRFPGGARAFASVSKTWHGSQNELELHVLCERASASWAFQRPDEIVVGTGATRSTVARPSSDPRGSRQAPGHGLGWIEGYVEVTAQMLRRMSGGEGAYPRLDDHLATMETLLRAGAEPAA